METGPHSHAMWIAFLSEISPVSIPVASTVRTDVLVHGHVAIKLRLPCAANLDTLGFGGRARPPARFGETPAEIFRCSPELAEAGYSADEITDLRERKVVR